MQSSKNRSTDGRGIVAWALALCIALVSVTGSACAAEATVRHAGYEYYHVGDLKADRSAPLEPALLLVGGGQLPRDGVLWWVARAGHGHVVILRASGADELQHEMYAEIGGVASVQTLVFHDRAAASDPQVLDILRYADAIFIAGGDQANYVRFWKDTPMNQVLDRHVAEGKPIGGTSAGLAILGGYAYGALDGGSITSADALHDPLGSDVTLVGGFLHLPNMQDVITDTHFNARHRLGRLIAFVANLRHAGHADVVGLGVDQGSALGVDGRGIGRLFTVDHGYAWLVQPVAGPARIEAGQPLDYRGVRVTGVGPRGRLDLRNLTVHHAAFQASADVRNGKLNLRGGPDPTPPAH
ncbi:MAG TPA: cyanophycinase [Rhodanobacter sp.]|nr:cyanophycinase [Rhodanobacter sp.]